MLLYQHTRGHYLAVPSALRFTPACGYRACYAGQDVPDIICAAFIREAGGGVLRESDVIELRAPVVGRTAARPQARPQSVASRTRNGKSKRAGWFRGWCSSGGNARLEPENAVARFADGGIERG